MTPKTTNRTGQVLEIPQPGTNWSTKKITPRVMSRTGPVRLTRRRVEDVKENSISRLTSASSSKESGRVAQSGLISLPDALQLQLQLTHLALVFHLLQV
jgi:hypothetical protein